MATIRCNYVHVMDSTVHCGMLLTQRSQIQMFGGMVDI